MNVFYEIRNGKSKLSYYKSLTFPAHLHKEIEIVYLFSGQTEICVDGVSFILSEGEASIIFSNQIHSYHDITEVRAAISIFNPDDFPEFYAVYKNRIPVSNQIPRAQLEQIHFAQQLRFIFQDYEKSDPLIQAGYTLLFNGKLLSQCRFAEKKMDYGTAVRDVLTYCNENYKSNLTLNQLSKELGLSKSYLSHLFGSSLKVNFRDFINSMRIKEAMHLIETTDLTITEIAYETGYANTRTFNRVFLKWTGTTPREHKNLLKKQQDNPSAPLL